MSETAVITAKVRFSYAHVFEAHSIEEGQKAKFSVSLLIDKADTFTINRINKAIQAAAETGKSKFSEKVQKIIDTGKIPKSASFKNPLRDGDEEREDNEEYKGKFFVNASSTRKPGLIGKDKEELYDDTDFYSGCYGRADVNFYAFNVSGNMGIACGLNNLQKLEEGERLGGGGRSAAEAFGDDEDDLM